MLRVDREIIPVLTTIAWDTAGHKPSVTSDPHGITVNAMDSESHWWVAAALALKETPNTVVERIALLVIQYRPHTVSIEIVGQSGAWKTLLINRLQAIPRDILPVLPYIVENKPPTNMNKLNRLEQTLEPLFKNGCITICACEECKEFVSQLSDYPQVDHVDMIDSLAQHDKVARPPDLTRIFDDYDYEAMEVLAEGGALDDPRKRLGCYAGHNTARRFSKN
jgi:phage terminase large subunit-like protein